MSEESKIYVNEIYGPVFQGEGATLGWPCVFLRLAGCNLACGFCDSAYTWDWKRFERARESHAREVAAVAEEVSRLASNCRRVVITGGEPLLQQQALFELTEKMSMKCCVFEVETAGSIPLRIDFADQYNVSLKLASSGNDLEKRIVPEAIKSFSPNKISWRTNWKFVVRELEDFNEVDALVGKYGLKHVYIMPEGVDTNTILERARLIAPAVIERGFLLTTRLHVLMYGNARKV